MIFLLVVEELILLAFAADGSAPVSRLGVFRASSFLSCARLQAATGPSKAT